MAGRLENELSAMFALAHQRSNGARIQLAGMLADIFLADDMQLSPREEQLVNELIDQLLARLIHDGTGNGGGSSISV